MKSTKRRRSGSTSKRSVAHNKEPEKRSSSMHFVLLDHTAPDAAYEAIMRMIAEAEGEDRSK